jgi:5-hydroxyisourate hydrolase-like protein (transthyretin family)
MKFKKKITAMFIAMVMLVSVVVTPVSAFIDIVPTFIPMDMQLSFDVDEVWGSEDVQVTISFMSTMSRNVPFTIDVTNGAKIMVEGISDVQFVTGLPMPGATGGISRPIHSVSVNNDGNSMTLSTGMTNMFSWSTLTFTVNAPLMSTSFSVRATSDNVNKDLDARGSIAVRSGLTINAPDLVDDVNTFTIYGNAMWNRNPPPPGSYVFLEVVDRNNPGVINFVESQHLAFVVGDVYTTGNTMRLFSDHPDGTYLIRAYLVDPNTWEFIGYAEREIEYRKRPDVLRVSLSRPNFPEAFMVDPPSGTGVRLTGVTTAPSRYVLNSHTVTARATLKFPAEVAAATNARFVAYTTYGTQTFSAIKSGSSFYAQLNNLRTDTTVTVNGVTSEPFVVLRYTFEGEEKEIFIGFMQIIIDPAGFVLDAETGLPVEGATVTLWRRDDNDDSNWLLWEAHDGQINPQITDATGEFMWDVEEGFYKIMVYHPDYNTIDSQYSTLFDPEIGLIEIPPERYDIMIFLPKQI